MRLPETCIAPGEGHYTKLGAAFPVPPNLNLDLRVCSGTARAVLPQSMTNPELLLPKNLHAPPIPRDGRVSNKPRLRTLGGVLPAFLTLPASRLSRNTETYSQHPVVFYRHWNAIRFAAGHAGPQWLPHASGHWLPVCPPGS